MDRWRPNMSGSESLILCSFIISAQLSDSWGHPEVFFIHSTPLWTAASRCDSLQSEWVSTQTTAALSPMTRLMCPMHTGLINSIFPQSNLAQLSEASLSLEWWKIICLEIGFIWSTWKVSSSYQSDAGGCGALLAAGSQRIYPQNLLLQSISVLSSAWNP